MDFSHFKGFEGWYFRHQNQNDTLSFIPGRAQSGAFVQMLTPTESRMFPVKDLSVNGSIIRAGASIFSPYGCRLNLPGVSGEIVYGKLTPLRRDIMGPFALLPMQCRHGVISMRHTLTGGVSVDGAYHGFDGGIGYIEKDSGTSFPPNYQWLQCNDFSQELALMAAIAEIPVGEGCFTGLICAIIFEGREYRFATYNGAKILAFDETHIRLARGKLLLEIDILPSDKSQPLYSPVEGQMTGVIRERVNAEINLRLWQHGTVLFDAHSAHASYEYVTTESAQSI